MKSGYDQFFKKVRENANQGVTKSTSRPRFEMSSPPERKKSPAPTVEQLRARLQEKKKKKAKKGISWKLAGVSFLGILVAAAGTFEHERIETLLKKVEISVIGSANAEEKPAAPAKPEAKAEGKAEGKKDGKEAEAAPKKEYTDEELNHFAKLNERKRELDAREEELSRMETELAAQKVELEKRMQELDKTRREISSVLEEKVKTDDKKVETLVQMYSNMKPQQAAKIFEEMDQDLAVDIIGRMKKKNSAEIMNLIKPEKAKIFTEKFAGYKRN